LTFDQARPLSKFLTAETETDVADTYAHRSVRSLEIGNGRHRQPPEAVDLEQKRQRRSLHSWLDSRSGMFKMMFVADPTDGATVKAKLEAIADEFPKEPETGERDLPVSTRLAKETIRRYLCDCVTEAVYHDRDGNIVGIDEARRTIPPKLFRQIHLRDHGGCSWPGCQRRSCPVAAVAAFGAAGDCGDGRRRRGPRLRR